MKPGRHICTACNAIYEEPKERLDPQKAAFASLPEDWKCQCGATKDKFQPCSCVAFEKPAQEHRHDDHCTKASR